jgi:ATP-dependent Clp protease adaptor protein ClpS
MNVVNIGFKPQQDEETDVLTVHEFPYCLIVWNDEVNTFEWVIETLIEICHHSPEQAEQCAMIIHTKGKYAVKQGDYDTLKPMRDAISDRGIGATIESVVEN